MYAIWPWKNYILTLNMTLTIIGDITFELTRSLIPNRLSNHSFRQIFDILCKLSLKLFNLTFHLTYCPSKWSFSTFSLTSLNHPFLKFSHFDNGISFRGHLELLSDFQTNNEIEKKRAKIAKSKGHKSLVKAFLGGNFKISF